MSLDDDARRAERAGVEVEKALRDAVPCPGRQGESCGRNCLPGQLFCRHHGGGAVEVITRAASAVRLEAARAMISSELAEGITKAVSLYLAVVDDAGQKTADRISAADRLIALSGGVDALRAGEAGEGEMSGPQAALAELLAVSGDDRLERLASRLGVGVNLSAEGEG